MAIQNKSVKTNKLNLGFENIRKIFDRSLKRSIDSEITQIPTKDLLFIDSANLMNVSSFKDHNQVTLLNNYRTHRMETSRFLRSGLR